MEKVEIRYFSLLNKYGKQGVASMKVRWNKNVIKFEVFFKIYLFLIGG